MKNNRRQFLKQSAAAAAGAQLVMMGNSQGNAMEPIQREVPPRMKLSFAAYSYRKYLQDGDPPSMDMFDFLQECAKLGLSASEPTSYYFPSKADKDYFIQFRHKAFMLGLDISGTAVGNVFTHPEGDKREEQLNYVRDWIDRAAWMGAPCIRIFAGNKSKGVSETMARDYAVETIEEACKYAGEKGIFLALENHGGVVATADGVLDIVRQVESPWFGVNLDTGNFHSEDPYKDIVKCAPYAVNVQVKVEMRAAGQSHQPADFERIIGILAEAGYSGYVALEYEAKEEPKEAVPRYIEQLQTILSKV